MATKRQPVRPPPNPYQTSTSTADLSPANRIAYEILAERRDLLPSVERIMNAGLTEDAAVRALTLFRGALAKPGDPHRDPRVAIARVSAGDAES